MPVGGSRSGPAPPSGPAPRRPRRPPGPRSSRPCATRSAAAPPTSTSRYGSPTTPPCHRKRQCAGRRAWPTARARPPPCSRQDTRGASASTNARNSPTSSARHRRLPSPWSYPGQRRRQTPHRPRALARGRTWATRVSSSSSNATRSTTVFWTPSRAGHTVVPRTPFSEHRFRTFRQPRTYARTACRTLTRSSSTHGDDRRAQEEHPRGAKRFTSHTPRSRRHQPCPASPRPATPRLTGDSLGRRQELAGSIGSSRHSGRPLVR